MYVSMKGINAETSETTMALTNKGLNIITKCKVVFICFLHTVPQLTQLTPLMNHAPISVSLINNITLL